MGDREWLEGAGEPRDIEESLSRTCIVHTHKDQVDVTTHDGLRPIPSRSTLAEDKSQVSSRRSIAETVSICAFADSESHTIRFLCVKFFTRCSALWLSEAALGKERLRSSDSRAV